MLINHFHHISHKFWWTYCIRCRTAGGADWRMGKKDYYSTRRGMWNHYRDNIYGFNLPVDTDAWKHFGTASTRRDSVMDIYENILCYRIVQNCRMFGWFDFR